MAATGAVRIIVIVAGVTAGADGLFGTADDVLIGGSGTRDVATSYAKIARIVVGGAVKTGTKSAGFVGQFVGQVTTGGVNFALSAGPGNDGDRTRELAPGSNIHVFEVPLPA